MLQEQYVERLKGSDLALPTVPEYLSLCAYLEKFKDRPVQDQKKLFEEARAWLGKMFKDYWLMTGTRADYHPDGSGDVIQGVGRDDSSMIKVSALVGPNRWIKEGRDGDEVIAALCGMGDIAYVNQSFKDVSGKDSYLWRMNNNPSVKQERPVVLGDDDGRFYVNANNGFGSGRALGVVTQREKFS